MLKNSTMLIPNLKLIKMLVEKNYYKEKIYGIEEFEISDSKLASSFFLIKKGHISINEISEKGENLILRLVSEGQTYGGVYFLKSKNFSYIKALAEETIIYEFSMETILKIIQTDYCYQKDLFKAWYNQHAILENRNELLKLKSVSSRLIGLLFRFNNQIGCDFNTIGDRIIVTPLNQEEISNFIRTNRMSVHSILRKLKDDLLIDYFKDRIILKKSFFYRYSKVDFEVIFNKPIPNNLKEEKGKRIVGLLN